MTTKKLMFGAAIAATIALVFPAQALATASSTITINDANASTVPANIYGGDKYDLTTGGTVEASGEANHSITSFWSGQSLELDSTNSVVAPEGWSLEYTADGGTTWSPTPPTRTSINGVRTSGSVNRVGADKYESKSHPVAVSSSSSFTSNGGGDGFNVIFAGQKVFNIYHHTWNSLTLQCHLKSNGDSCYTGSVPVFSGYSTNNAATGFYDGNTNAVYAYAMRNSDRHVGFLKIDVSNINNVSSSTPVFIPLTQSPIPGLVSSTTYQKYMNTASRSGDLIWSIDGVSDQLLCMKISTGAACPDAISGSVTRSVNRAAVSTVGFSSNGFHGGARVTAVGSKVIYTTQTKIGCFDSATGLGCNGSALNELSFSAVNNFPPFPVWDSTTAGNPLLGYCHYEAKTCITLEGASLTIPASLNTWITAKGVLPLWNTRENAGEWASQGKKIYFPGNATTSVDNTTDADCYDSTTGLACAGFTGTNVGVRIYALVADPLNSNCVWTNGDAGEIKSFNATTGALGCSVSTSLVEMSYQTIAPRFGCVESKRVYTWVTATFTGTADVALADLKITVLDSNGSAISGWVDRTVDGTTGLLSLAGLTTSDTGMRPTLQITSADTNDTPTMLEGIFGAITFTAEAPQLCFVLKAVTKCPGVTVPAGDHSVPDGIVDVTTSTTPVGLASITSTARSVTPGTAASGLCAASTPNYTPPSGGGGGSGTVTQTPVVTPPKTKRPPVTITIGGFRDGSPILTKTIQNKIKAFLKKYNDYPVIETTGFTEGPVVLKTDYALSRARAVNATSFIKTKLKKSFSVVKIKSGQDKVEASKVRRIKITLTDE